MDAVLNWVWQGSVVAVASFVMLLALERARANVRYIVCWAALFVVVALPALPSLQLTAVSTEALRAPQGDAMVSLPDTWWTSALVVLAAWVVWASVHLVRFVAAIATIRRARAHSHPFPLNVESKLSHWVRVSSTRRRATLVVSESVTAAAVLGWGTPMIAVSPSVVKTLDADELDRILIHEWAHVQRRDDLVNIVQIAVRSIVGWHPALWWIDRRLHVEREIACDEMTVAITGSPKTYAECLMKLASLRTTPRTMRAAPAVLTSSGLRARIIKIVSVHPSIAPLWSRSIAVAIVTVLCLMATGLGGLKLVEATGTRAANRVFSDAQLHGASHLVDRGADTLFRCEDGSVAPNEEWCLTGPASADTADSWPATENRLGRRCHARRQPRARFGRANTSES